MEGAAGGKSFQELYYIQPICDKDSSNKSDFIGAENGVLPQVCFPREGYGRVWLVK